MYTIGAHQTSASLFKEKTQKLINEVQLEVRNKMSVLTKKSKAIIAVLTVVALAFIVALPYGVDAQTSQTSSPTSIPQTSANPNAKQLKAVGYGFENVSDVIQKMPANLTLFVEPTKASFAGKLFKVDNGTVYVDGTAYTITGGNGGVSYAKRVFVLKAQGTSPDGQSVTLKLEGQYFWMWGRLYAARIQGSLQFGNTKMALFLRGAIRV
jgi:hypothetical protein